MVGVPNYVEDPLRTIDVTIKGTRNIIDIALKHEIKVLFTSTSEVFGRNPKVPWDEDDDRVLGSTRVDRWAFTTTASRFLLLRVWASSREMRAITCTMGAATPMCRAKRAR